MQQLVDALLLDGEHWRAVRLPPLLCLLLLLHSMRSMRHSLAGGPSVLQGKRHPGSLRWAWAGACAKCSTLSVRSSPLQ